MDKPATQQQLENLVKHFHQQRYVRWTQVKPGNYVIKAR